MTGHTEQHEAGERKTPETRTITFKADTVKMFDMIAKTGGDFDAVGSRLASSLLGGTGWVEAIGLAAYGIEIVEENLARPTPNGEPAGGWQQEQAWLIELAAYAASVLGEPRFASKRDDEQHTTRLDGTGITYGTLRALAALTQPSGERPEKVS